MKEWKKIFHTNRNQRKARVTTFIKQHKLKPKNVTRGHYKKEVNQEDLTIVNIYEPKIGAPILHKANINHSEVRNRQQYNRRIPYSTFSDGLYGKKIIKETLALNYMLDQMDDLTEINSTFHPKAPKHTF